MKNKGYIFSIFIYVLQLILLSALINNNLMKKQGFFQSSQQDTVELFLGIVIMILNIASIFVIRHLYNSYKIAAKQKIMDLKNQHAAEQIRISRQHRHDLKNHLSVIRCLLDKQDYQELDRYLSDYTKAIDESMVTVETGVHQLDVLFLTKFNEAKNKNIMVHFQCSAFVKSAHKYITDLVSLFGNVLDNAIEACTQIEGKHTRQISIMITENPLDYNFKITNTFTANDAINTEDIFRQGVSTKGANRGQGLAIVKKIVKKLEGEVRITAKDSVFQITIDIPKYKLEA